MSVRLMSIVWPMDLPTTEKMVLLALADAANDDGVTWIAVASRRKSERLDLTRKCSLSERAVQGALKRLEAAGHLTRDEKPGKGVIYHLTPAADAPPHDVRPADNDVNPRRSCGETVSNHQPLSEANASSRVRARASRRCPDDWAPSPEDMAVVIALGFTPGQMERELATIRDFEFRTARSDWSAVYRNWFRTEAKRSPPNVRPANDPSPRIQRELASYDRSRASLERAAAVMAARRAL